GLDLPKTEEYEVKPGIFNGDFHMEFCDNKRQLFQAYFRDFQIERLDSPWRRRHDRGHDVPAVQFMNKYGTHYINSYVTGNSLYQVFVFNKRNYAHIKEKLKSRGVLALVCVDTCMTTRPLRLSYYVFTYSSLLKLHGDGALLRILSELLQNEAILQLDLKSLSVIFKEPAKRAWFEEILDNYLKLWEVNM
ncbi:hypothetical protein pipiens_016461, partial [Culex pipiens pipiens]